MAFMDKVKDFMDKSMEVSKNALSKAGEAVQDFGDKSVTRIEIKKLESKQEKLICELGSFVYEKINSEKTENISSSDEVIQSIVSKINEVKDQISSKTEELEKKDENN